MPGAGQCPGSVGGCSRLGAVRGGSPSGGDLRAAPEQRRGTRKGNPLTSGQERHKKCRHHGRRLLTFIGTSSPAGQAGRGRTQVQCATLLFLCVQRPTSEATPSATRIVCWLLPQRRWGCPL